MKKEETPKKEKKLEKLKEINESITDPLNPKIDTKTKYRRRIRRI